MNDFAAKLKASLDYCAETGVFTWRAAKRGMRAGAVAGTTDGKGYGQICFDGVLYRSHRLAWFYVHGAWPLNDIDHMNGVRSDNRIANLRDVSRSVNLQNKGCQSRSLTGVVGVSPSGKNFTARIKAPGSAPKYLGSFPSIEEASRAREAAKQLLHTNPV